MGLGLGKRRAPNTYLPPHTFPFILAHKGYPEAQGTGKWRVLESVCVSLNALCVSVIRNLMALSEIPKLYLAG